MKQNVTLKNYEMVALFNAVEKVKDKNLPISLSFAIAENRVALIPLAQIYETKRQEIMDKYKEPNEQISEEDAEKYTELINLEVEVNLSLVSKAILDNWNDKYDKIDFEQLTGLIPMFYE